MADIVLVRPSHADLPGFVAALEAGWSPDNIRKGEAAREFLGAIAADADAFLMGLEDPEARRPPIRLPDGTMVARLPNITRWISDGSFCGSIGLRWQPGTSELPPHVLGHIGYAVVPWKRRRGCAKAALAAILPEARARGLAHVDVTTDLDNPASQAVILACGGRPLGRFRKVAAHGGSEGLKFRIDLDAPRGS